MCGFTSIAGTFISVLDISRDIYFETMGMLPNLSIDLLSAWTLKGGPDNGQLAQLADHL